MALYYLYVKTHNVTGLKYLGYTKRDVYQYSGSGIDWQSHLEEFGYDFNTTVLLQTEDKKEINDTGRFFSELWDVANSSEWANKIPETGGGSGQFRGRKHTIESREKMKASQKRISIGKKPTQACIDAARISNSKPKTAEHRANLSASLTGKSYAEQGRSGMSIEAREKLSRERKGKPRSEETKQKLREAAQKQWALKRAAA